MLSQGIHRNLSNSLYHSDEEFLSSSVIKTAYQSMGKYRDVYIDGNRRSPSDSMRIGSAFHSLVLEPEKFPQDFPVFDNVENKRTTKAGKEAFKTFKSSLKSKHDFIQVSELEKVKSMAREVSRYQVSNDLFQQGEPEVSIATSCPLTGLPIKVRPDWLDIKNKRIVDLKSARDPDFNSFSWKVCKDFYYGLSATIYDHALKTVTGDDFDFYWVVTGNEAPYDTYVYKASESVLTNGFNQYKKGCENIINSKETNEYFAQDGVQEMIWRG